MSYRNSHQLVQQVIEKEGRTPQKKDLEAYGFPVSKDTICRRFGPWRKALVRAHASITEESVSAEPVDTRAIEARKRTSLYIRKRFFVLKRDHFACVRCGASGVGVRLEVPRRHLRQPGDQARYKSDFRLDVQCHRIRVGWHQLASSGVVLYLVLSDFCSEG
jgi:hypothetical protein